MGLVAVGDHDAFTVLFGRHRRRLRAVAYRVCRDPAHAEDVVQDVFVSIWQRAGRYSAERGSPTSWLSAITRNRAIDVTRRRTDVVDLPDYDDLQMPRRLVASDADAILMRERRAAIDMAMTSLPERQQRAVRLWESGLTHADIARTLELPLGTVKSRIRHGLHTLRRVLELEDAIEIRSPASGGRATRQQGALVNETFFRTRSSRAERRIP